MKRRGPEKVPVNLRVNGGEYAIAVEPRRTLLDALREDIGLTGAKRGCDEGTCGACTVLLDGRVIYACMTLAIACEGQAIETIENLERDGRLHPIQQAFVEEDALQCGFCTPGQVMAVKGLLDVNPHPTAEEVRRAVTGNLCRCGAYPKIVRAALKAAERMLGGPMLEVKKTRVEFEGNWFEKFVVAEGEGLPCWEGGSDLQTVGRKIPRIDGGERVSGRAVYTSDIRLPGMLHGKILRSPYPHAQIKNIETGPAARLCGVRAVMTFRNIPRIPFARGLTLLFDERVRYAGDEVACVLADEEEIARDALELIAVEYEELPFVLDAEEALRPGAPALYPGGNLFRGTPEIYERGDPRQGFAEAYVTVEEKFRTQTALHNCLETHGSVALWEGDRLKIWDSTQHIFGVRAGIADLLQLPLHKVRVIKQFMGGGFGSKNAAGKYTVLAALGARMTGRPVKIILDRAEENLAAGNRPSSAQVLRIGARRDGALTAIHLQAFVGAGTQIPYPPAVGGPVRQLYACPHVKTEQYTVFTNTGPMSAFRGPGYVEGTFALEALMDQLAEKLGIDPLDLRMRNYAEINQVTGQPYTTKGLKEAYELGARRIGWQDRQRGEAETKRRGWGMASQIWGGGGGPPAYALVKLNPDGTATVVSGTQDLGTGTRTVLAQIAAEELGIPIENIAVELGDTQTGPYAPISAGSMTVPSVGPAVRVAAHDARRQLLQVASQLLSHPPDSLAIRDGRFQGPGLKEPVALKAILAKLENFMIVGRGARAPNPEKANVNTFGAQFVEVEVDTATGALEIKKIVAVHDSGRVLNPLTISSQIEGGILQGTGFAVLEERIVDRTTGRVVNANLEDYKVLTMLDAPPMAHEMVDRPDVQANNLGVKGVGEPPIIPTAAAIANAVADALHLRFRDLPITRERILRAMKEKA